MRRPRPSLRYATLLSRNSRVDTLTPLGHHHPRGLVLPFAVSADANAVREFKISGHTDGCASLLDPVATYYSPSCTNMSGILERRAVPSVSLEMVLGTWLRGRSVEPVSVRRLSMTGMKFTSAFDPLRKAMETIRPSTAAAFMFRSI